MKLFLMPLALGLAALSFASGAAAALASPGRFQIVPAPGVTVVDLPQERLNAISAEAGNRYQAGIERAQERYTTAMRAIGINPNVDSSGEILNGRALELIHQREMDFVSAKYQAGDWAEAACANLCHVQYID